MGNVVKVLITVAIACAISCVVGGLILYLGNNSVMVHSLFEHFGIADLTYGQYASGSFVTSLVVTCLSPMRYNSNKD